MVKVEIIYPLKQEQNLVTLELPEDATVSQAIEQSGLLQTYPEIDLDCNPVGIFSQKVNREQRLRDGDRVEIYRPLSIDPKEARRMRALKKTS